MEVCVNVHVKVSVSKSMHIREFVLHGSCLRPLQRVLHVDYSKQNVWGLFSVLLIWCWSSLFLGCHHLCFSLHLLLLVFSGLFNGQLHGTLVKGTCTFHSLRQFGECLIYKAQERRFGCLLIHLVIQLHDGHNEEHISGTSHQAAVHLEHSDWVSVGHIALFGDCESARRIYKCGDVHRQVLHQRLVSEYCETYTACCLYLRGIKLDIGLLKEPLLVVTSD